MLSYCLKCRKDTESKNPKVVRTKNGRTMLLSKCAVCNSKKSKFLKEQEASGLLSSLGIKTLLSKISLVGPLLFLEYLNSLNFGSPHIFNTSNFRSFNFRAPPENAISHTLLF